MLNFLEKNKNYDLRNYSSKNFEEFINNEIGSNLLCPNNQVCPIWPQKEQIIHWDIEDPLSKLQNQIMKKKEIIIKTILL